MSLLSVQNTRGSIWAPTCLPPHVSESLGQLAVIRSHLLPPPLTIFKPITSHSCPFLTIQGRGGRHRSSHLNSTHEPYINRHLLYRPIVNCCINCVLVFHSFAMILLVEHTCNFSRDFNKNYFLQARPSESAVSAYKQTSYTSSYLNFIRGRQWANPCALILDIEGAPDHSSLNKSQLIKIQNMYIILV